MQATLRTYLREKMDRDHLSARQAGLDAGVAHTTILRILEGRNVSLDTLDKIAAYVGADPGTLIGGDDSLEKNISAILQMEPELGRVFEIAMEKVRRGELTSDTVREIVKYVSWRINYESDVETSRRAETALGGDSVYRNS